MRMSEPAREAAVAMLAAADMAISKLSWVWSWRRMSTRTVARPCQGSSSWRIMISSSRAVEGQCTRRRSSPTWYSRMA